MTIYINLPLEAIKITNRKHEVIDADGDTVCRVVAPKIGRDGYVSVRDAGERTGLIVRAVNAHNDLVAALDSMVLWMTCNSEGLKKQKRDEVLALARAAVLKAKEGVI